MFYIVSYRITRARVSYVHRRVHIGFYDTQYMYTAMRQDKHGKTDRPTNQSMDKIG
ncbi:hypothetical protein NB16F75_39260 [Escherichia coli]